MTMWQDIAVVAIVGSAIFYLYRKLIGGGPQKKKAPPSFVPLSDLKRKR